MGLLLVILFLLLGFSPALAEHERCGEPHGDAAPPVPSTDRKVK